MFSARTATADFASVVLAWLACESRIGKLRFREEHDGVVASVPALSTWPAAGATVYLFTPRRAFEAINARDVELIAVDQAVLVPTTRCYVSLPLLEFGPKDIVAPSSLAPGSSLGSPALRLRRWATRLNFPPHPSKTATA